MSLMKDKSMKRKIIGSSDHDDRNDSNAEKKRRRKNAVETPKHCPLSERQQLALLMQMTSVENSPEPASPPPSIRRTPGSSGRKDRVHRRNERGETLLHLSTIKGDLETMKELIKQGAEVNVQDFAGWTPLHEACNHGHQEITSYLLEVGANVNSRGLEDDTPLHDAVTNSHRDLVELLLKHGANPLLKNKRGERPLDIAEDPVIQELMQKEVIISDESDSEMDVPSPVRSESSLESRRFMSKIRTTSSSSSNRELFKNEDRSGMKKRQKSKNGLTIITPLTSDSSSDSSDSSDDSSLPEKLQDSTPNTPLSNESGRSLVKTPSLSATPPKFPNFSSKKKRKKEGSGKLPKTIVPTSKTARSDLATSSDASSDSEKRIRRKDNDDNHNRGFLSKVDKREHTKGKSLYYNDKTLLQGQASHKNKPLLSDLPSKAKQLSREKEGELNNKTQRYSDEPTSKSSSQKVNGCHSSFNSNTHEPDTSSYPKKKTAESIYDFSLSTEDSTTIGAISLKQKSKDKASELFDVLCLGKPSQNVEIENRDNTPLKPFEVNHGSLKQKISAPKPLEKDDYFQLTITNTKEQNEFGFDKNHNKIVGHNSVKSTHSCTESKHKSTSQSPVEKKLHPFLEKSPVEKKSHVFPAKHTATKDNQQTTAEADSSINKVKSETKADKKIKKPPVSSDSPKKQATGAPPTSSKVDSVKKQSSELLNKKQLIKLEYTEDGKAKQKTPDMAGEVRSVSTDNVGSSSVKKKKKHKHSKHAHDHTNSDSKHRMRVGSSEVASSNITEKDKLLGKTLLKRSDSVKSDSVKPQSGSISRKSSHEGKTESGATIPARKKVRSIDSTSSETSVKTSKHNSSSAPKSVQEKQIISNSVKKDKPEPKKISLLSDANSFFLSELEKSSLQREMERKKLKRKKRLLQQQKLKVKVQSGSTRKDLKSSGTPGNAVNTGDKSTTPLFPSEFPSADQGRRVSLPTENIGAPNQSITQPPDFGFSPVPHHGVTDDQSRPFQGYFRSPPFAARSNSQVDPRVRNVPSEILKQGEQLPFGMHDKRHHLPVQRSLSFSNPSVDDATPGRNLPFHPEAKRHLQHDVGQLRHSIDAPADGVRQNYPATLVPDPNMDGASSDSKFAHVQNIGPIQNVGDGQPVSVDASGQPVSGLPLAFDNNVVAKPPTFDSDSGTKLTSSESKDVKMNSVDDVKTAEDGAVQENASEVKVSESAETINPEDKVDLAEGEQPPKTQAVESSEVLVNKEEVERKLLLENYVKERLSQLKAVIEEPEPKRLPVFIPMEKLKRAKKDPMQDRLNVYEEWSIIQDQINERRKKYSTVVIPEAPQCYWEYMTFTGGYLLSGSRESWLSVPVLAPPPSLNEETHSLFTEQEKERVKLRLQHATQREKLIVACEQEIMRVHSRAARTHQNQQQTLSACSVLLDREIYNVERRNKKVSEESNTNRTASIRDRFNTRMFLSWLQDVNDKYRKMKDVLLTRQRHEAQALHAVQRTEWLLKLQEGDRQGQQRWSNVKPEEVNQLHVPLVNISDDFDLLPR